MPIDPISIPNVVNRFGITELAQTITASDTSLTLVDASKLSLEGGSIQIDGEIMIFASRAGNVLSGLLRGQDNTSAAPHVAGAKVTSQVVAVNFNSLKDAVLELDAAKFNEPAIVDPENNQLLVYNETTGVWENGFLPAFDGATSELDGTAGGVPAPSMGDQNYFLRGDGLWAPPIGAVESVNGQTGIVVLDKGDIGLGNVDNTSDLDKPISTATQTALDEKFDNPAGTSLQYVAGDGTILDFPEFASADSLVIRVRNRTGVTIPKGSAVYINGATGNRPNVALASSSSEATSSKVLGLTREAIANNSDGIVLVRGTLTNVDTKDFEPGQALWLGSTPGTITVSKPVAPLHMVFIGVCIIKNPSNGSIEVQVQNGFEIDELHDVLIVSKQDGQVIQFESASNLWKNVTLTKASVGLSNVDNTSDVNKPISSATQTALDLKLDKNAPITAATKTKITYDANGLVTAGSDLASTDIPAFNGATTAYPGSLGGVPQPGAGDENKFLRADATWQLTPNLVESVNGETGVVVLDKGDIGLGNVDNTSDLDKPISSATQTALDSKLDENAAITGATKTKITYDAKGLVTAGADLSNTDVPSFTGASSLADGSLGGVPQPLAGDQAKYLRADGSWSTVTAGVESVNGQTGIVVLDKSDIGLSNADNTSDLDKPVSTATQTALNGKVDENAPITGATKTKITYDAKGLVTSGTDLSNTDVPSFTGATSTLAGTLGGVPAPSAGDQEKFLCADGTWSIAGGAVDSVNGQTGIVVLTKADLGLANVDNTADLDKPISDATQTALDGKVDENAPITGATKTKITYDSKGLITAGADLSNTDVPAFTGASALASGTLGGVPIAAAGDESKFLRADGSWQTIPPDAVSSVNGQTGVVVLDKGDIGLGNVDNTSDLDKPISTATQTALDGKVDENAAITGATKTKITYDAKGLVTAGADLSNTDVPAFTGATAIASGSLGGVPIPAAGDEAKYLRADGSWQLTPPDAVTSVNGQTGVVVLTKSDVGLSNVDNTSDLDKPISTATQTALDGKVDENAAITGATKTKITYDSKGLVTAGADLSNTDVPAFTGATAIASGSLGGVPAPLAGDEDKFLKADGSWSNIPDPTIIVTQVAHGFAVGNALYLNGSTYTKAIATTAIEAEVVGVVGAVIDADNFELTLVGEVSGLSGLTPGEVYFLSDATAGLLTTTEPTTIGNISIPIAIAKSSTALYVDIKRGLVVGSANARTQIGLANNATTNVQSVSSYDAGELTGWVIINNSVSANTKRFYVSAPFAKYGGAANYYISPSFMGDIPPIGFSMTVTSAGMIQITMPNVSGFTSAVINYALNAPAVGTNFPLSIDGSLIAGGIINTAVLPVASGTQAGIVNTGAQTFAGVKTFSSTIVGSITGNAGTVTNGVYTSGNQTISGTKTFTNAILATDSLEMGGGRTVDGLTYIDFITQAGADFNTRFIRGAGANGTFIIDQLGTGSLLFNINGSQKVSLSSTQLYLNSVASRGFSGYVITTPNNSVANAIRSSGYIEWQTDVGAIGTSYFLSDENKKENIAPSVFNSSDLLSKINFIQFDWSLDSGNSGHVEVGVSAQKLQAIDARLVNELSDGSLMVNEPALVAHIAKALQEQMEEIKALKAEIEALKGLNNV